MQYLTIRRQGGASGASATTGAAGLVDERIPLPDPPSATGATLAQVIYLSGLVSPPALCSGLGRCGRCRVRFLSETPEPLPIEHDVLSHHDIEDGWRLSCRHAPAPGMHVLLPPPAPYAGEKENQENTARPDRTGRADPDRSAQSICAAEKGTTSSFAGLKLAVDLGTTSLHWLAASAGGAKNSPANAGEESPSAAGVMINPQMGAGSDVMSRLAYAATSAGAQTLQGLTVNALARICEGLGPVTELCLAANPAMTAITLGKDTAGLARAPYRLDYAGGRAETLPNLPPLWVPPQISPFIGGDISAGYAALLFDPAQDAPRFPFLFADMGTNGECLLALSPEETLAASVPLGPALEGINLTFGTAARFGAVTAYSVTPLGLQPRVLGDTAPGGITAAGYLSLLQALRKSGLLTPEGFFAGNAANGRLADRIGTAERKDAGEARLRLPGRMYLAASDVEEILKVKAAFSLAVSRLLAEAGLAPSKLTALYFAGALGTHVPADALEDLGFIPPGFAAKVRAPGNTALAGARLFLDRRQTREQSLAWAETVRTLELANDPAFTAAYAEHMVFAWR